MLDWWEHWYLQVAVVLATVVDSVLSFVDCVGMSCDGDVGRIFFVIVTGYDELKTVASTESASGWFDFNVDWDNLARLK